MLLPNRHGNSSDYRYGFNGKEMDDEVKGEGAQYDYGFRIYDVRLGKFLSRDPLFKTYPWYTPYQFAGNSPIMAIDLDGLELKVSNSSTSCVELSEKKSKIKLELKSHVHFKVLNATSTKLEGLEKVMSKAGDEINKSYSDLSGTGTMLRFSDFEGNSQRATYFDVTAVNEKFTTSYQEIKSIEQIKADDYVIILTDKDLTGVSYGKNNDTNPPAYTSLQGQVMIINLTDDKFNINKNTNGNYDFNSSTKGTDVLGNTISHEFGHQLGLDDKYDYKTFVPFTGFEKNRMGRSGYSSINSQQKKEVIMFLARFYEQFNLEARKGNKHHSGENAKEDAKDKLSENNIEIKK